MIPVSDHDQAIAEIWQAYLEDRARTDRSATMESSNRVADICRYCAGPWQRWEQSKLDGHAACIVTDEFRIFLARKLRDNPGITFATMAATLEVSRSVVRSWSQVGAKRLKMTDSKKKAPVIKAWEMP